MMPPRRPRPVARTLWLATLADLALLLVGFFALLQVTRPAERPELVQAIRAGLTDAPPSAMAVEMAAVTPFTAGSALPPSGPMKAAIAWARGAARDPRTRIELIGVTDAAGDTDPVTGSAPLLATDRARAVAAALVRAGAVRPDQISISAAGAPAGRGVQLRLAFSGSHEVTE